MFTYALQMLHTRAILSINQLDVSVLKIVVGMTRFVFASLCNNFAQIYIQLFDHRDFTELPYLVVY